MLRLCALACALFIVMVPARGFAADTATESHSSTEPDSNSTPPTDVRDVWHKLRHKSEPPADEDQASKPFLVVTPSLTSKPSTGVMIGVAANRAFVQGDPADTHISLAAANLKVSTQKQTTSAVRYGIFSSADRWFLQGDNRLQWTSLNVYGTGLSTPATLQNLDYDWFRVNETAYRKLGRRLFVGGGVNVSDHRNVGPGENSERGFAGSEYVAYSNGHGFALDGAVSSGVNASLLIDTRDNSINAYRGSMASVSYRTFFKGFLGGDANWEEVSVDARTYRALSHDARQRIGLWFLGDFVSGGTAPYLDLPSTSNDIYGRSARGYAEGRYRGPHLLYAEAEYRGALTANGLVGVVAFLNVTTLDGFEPNQHLFRDYAPGAGLGLRLLLDKHSRTNLCADYGVGRQGSSGFYLAIQEAF
jgi:outer membrane protein assembly factor BamA